jgi:hypothetical protein
VVAALSERWVGRLAGRLARTETAPNQIPEHVRAAICRIRSELEAETEQPDKLLYIGATSIRARLKQEGCQFLPGISTIEPVLRDAGKVRARHRLEDAQTVYPQLHPSQPHQLAQVDIVPHYLTGGALIACFNGIDPVSRFPDGQQHRIRKEQRVGHPFGFIGGHIHHHRAV